MINTTHCIHPRITVYLHYYPASYSEPAKWVGYGECDECGGRLSLDDISDGAICRDTNEKRVELK